LPDESFPATRHSVVRALRSEDVELRQRAFDAIVASYWKPVYKYLRIRWKMSREDAEDMTQEFFAGALDKQFLGGYEPSRARFRTFLRICVDRAAQNALRAASRMKRGGGMTRLSVDYLAAEDELRVTDPSTDMDEFFRLEWIRALFELAIERLRGELVESGKGTHYAIFEAYDIAGRDAATPVTYRELAERFEIPETQVTNFLAYARRRLRQHVLDALSELTGSDEEMAAEAREVLGVVL
jgi:RNA polymerase sigma factor (sigma-70 family)